MLRQTITDSLKIAMKTKDERATSALRMVLAALKERDIDARGKGKTEGIAEPEIQSMVQGLIKKCRDSIEMYQKGGRADLVAKENADIAVMQKLLPRQMDEAATAAAVKKLVDELGAKTVKDMGRVMAALKERHAGQIDMGKAGAIVKQHLSA